MAYASETQQFHKDLPKAQLNLELQSESSVERSCQNLNRTYRGQQSKRSSSSTDPRKHPVGCANDNFCPNLNRIKQFGNVFVQHANTSR